MLKINRREFLITGGVAITGLMYLPACASRMMEEGNYRFFTRDEARCVIALCEQIIPSDEEFGGATDAGVIIYIDRQLAGYFNNHASTYRESLEKLQEYCRSEFGKAFHELSSPQQIDVMERMEANKLGGFDWPNPGRFFNLVIAHTMQGFYGSPIHGGNREYMSYNMLQLEYPLNIGQNRYEKPLHNS